MNRNRPRQVETAGDVDRRANGPTIHSFLKGSAFPYARSCGALTTVREILAMTLSIWTDSL